MIKELWHTRPHFFPRGKHSVKISTDIRLRINAYMEWLKVCWKVISEVKK